MSVIWAPFKARSRTARRALLRERSPALFFGKGLDPVFSIKNKIRNNKLVARNAASTVLPLAFLSFFFPESGKIAILSQGEVTGKNVAGQHSPQPVQQSHINTRCVQQTFLIGALPNLAKREGSAFPVDLSPQCLSPLGVEETTTTSC